MASQRDIQLRRGLAKSLDFLTHQALARRAQEEQASAAQQRFAADSADAAEKQRYQAALDLAKLGNVGAQAGLQDYARTGDLGSALGSIGEFDQTAARNRGLAKDFVNDLLQREQIDAATSLAQSVPGMEGLRFTPPPRQQAQIDLLGAQKLKVDTDRQIVEARKNAYIGHLAALTKGANAKLKQIERETANAERKGKIDSDYIAETDKALSSLEDTIGREIKQRLDDPTSYTDPEYKTDVLPDVKTKLQELYETYSDIRARKQRIANYREGQLPFGTAPMQNPPRQTVEQFRNQLMERLLPRGIGVGQGKPILNW